MKLWPPALAASGAKAMAPGWQEPVVSAGAIDVWFGAAVGFGHEQPIGRAALRGGERVGCHPTACCRM